MIQPIYDRILVKRITAEEVSPGGIVIPENAKEKPTEAIVVAVGEGKRDEYGDPIPLLVAVGERVLFSKYSGTEIKVDGQDMLIVREEDVLAIVR